MSGLFEELDYQQTALGELILRRRKILKLDRDVVEVILNDEHLMSTVVEYLSPIIEWHEAGFLPLGTRLSDDPRCRFVEGDFFDLARGDAGSTRRCRAAGLTAFSSISTTARIFT